MKEIKIVSRWDENKILICGKYESIKDCLEKNRANLTGAYLRGADLRGADLTGADLEGADLRGAYLTGAYLRGADLTGANLTGAYLTGAYLTGAYLTGADLEGADLRGAYLIGAYLRGADLRGADLEGADLTGADLRVADLRVAYLTGAKEYVNSHAFFKEIIRRQSIKTFTSKEWMIIGQIIVHFLCWDTIKNKYSKSALTMFNKLKKAGFGEWAEKYKELLK